MLDQFNYCWRWLATAFSFFIFGVGGIILTFVVFPILSCVPAEKLDREARAKAIIHHTFRLYIELMRKLGVLSYEIEGLSKLKNAQLVLANHPSLIDVVFLIALIPNANCVIKGKLVRNPFTRSPVRTAGYIINEDNEHVLEQANDSFTKQHALIVFPEGTRSVPDNCLALKRGAANIAVRAEADITPIIIQCSPSTLTKKDSWYQIPKKRAHFKIQIKDKIAINPYLSGMPPSVSARRLTTDLTNYFNKELKLNV